MSWEADPKARGLLSRKNQAKVVTLPVSAGILTRGAASPTATLTQAVGF